jgi:hypothetical protein
MLTRAQLVLAACATTAIASLPKSARNSTLSPVRCESIHVPDWFRTIHSTGKDNSEDESSCASSNASVFILWMLFALLVPDSVFYQVDLDMGPVAASVFGSLFALTTATMEHSDAVCII